MDLRNADKPHPDYVEKWMKRVNVPSPKHGISQSEQRHLLARCHRDWMLSFYFTVDVEQETNLRTLYH
jgi:hypothetical protein